MVSFPAVSLQFIASYTARDIITLLYAATINSTASPCSPPQRVWLKNNVRKCAMAGPRSAGWQEVCCGREREITGEGAYVRKLWRKREIIEEITIVKHYERRLYRK